MFTQFSKTTSLLFVFAATIFRICGVAAENTSEISQPVTYVAELTLKDVVEMTYERNPDVQVLPVRQRQAAALSRQSHSFWAEDPAIFAISQQDELFGGDGKQEWEWGLELPIWLPGQRAARQSVAEHAGLQVAASDQALRLRVAGIVRKLLWDIALKENQLSVRKREWKVALKLAADVKKRVDLGDLAQTDLILADQDVFGREVSYLRAETSLRQVITQYRNITGLSTVPADYSEQPAPINSLSADHPLLTEVQAKVERAKALRAQTKKEKRANPSITVGTKHERDNSDDDFVDSLSLAFRLPLGLESQTAPKLAAGELQLAEARGERDRLRRELQIEIETAARALQAIRKEFDLAEKQNALAKRNLALARKAFSLGETDLLSLLRVQTKAFAAERLLQRRQLEMGRNSARLNQAAGVIP